MSSEQFRLDNGEMAMGCFGPNCKHRNFCDECGLCARRRVAEHPYSTDEFLRCLRVHLEGIVRRCEHETRHYQWDGEPRVLRYSSCDGLERGFWEIVGGIQNKPLRAWAYELGVRDVGYDTVANGWVSSAEGEAVFATSDGKLWKCHGFRPRGNARCIFAQGGVTPWE